MSCATGEPVELVILDLDGTILDTESLVLDVAQRVLASHGASLTPEAMHAGVGMRPLEAWAAVAAALGLGVPAEQLLAESEPLLQARWPHARMLPGAARLIGHLAAWGVRMALATSTPRATFGAKAAGHPQLLAAFAAVVCGDEVARGKPAPDGFTAAAAACGVPPCRCLVVEDAPSGVQAAVAAGMRVVAVPSVLDKSLFPAPDPSCASGCVAVLPSLLEFRGDAYGLPPFDDVIGESIPLDTPFYLKGPVVKGVGRGSRELGIRTANLDEESLAGCLAEAVTGIFYGWASVGADRSVHRVVTSIGFNPFFKNKEKTAEPWILHDFEEDFYGQELRLLVCGYIRPEADFTTLQALIDRIHRDGEVAREALQHPRMAAYQHDPFLRPALPHGE